MIASNKLIALAVSALLLSVGAMDASAREVYRQRTVTTPAGETYSSSTTATTTANGDGTASRDVTHVGPAGGVTTVEGNASCVEGQGCSRSKVVTGPNGNQAARSSSTYTTGDGAIVHQSQFTGPRGRTVSRSITRRR